MRTLGVLLTILGIGVVGWALSARQSALPVGSVTSVLPSPTTPRPVPVTAPVPAPGPSPSPASRPSPAPEPAADPDPPVRLSIAAVGIEAEIDALGVDEEGRMAVPDDVARVGWYRYGPAPGQDGSAVLAAHVDSARSGPGVFFSLSEVGVGARVIVTHASGAESVWVVAAREVIPKAELPLARIFSRVGEPVVTLVTCGGSFSRAEQRYDSNVVVVAIPAPDESRPTPESVR